MIKNVYSVFDSASGVYAPPMAYVAEGEAIRDFGDFAVNPDSKIALHPEHFSLWYVGQFNDATGEFVQDMVTVVARAHELIAQSRSIDKKAQLDLVERIENGEVSHG